MSESFDIKRYGAVAVVLASGGALAFLGQYALQKIAHLEDHIHEVQLSQEAMRRDLDKATDDSGKWAALAGLQEQVQQLRIRSEVQILLFEKLTTGLRDDATERFLRGVRDGREPRFEPGPGPDAPLEPAPLAPSTSDADILRHQYEQRAPNSSAKGAEKE